MLLTLKVETDLVVIHTGIFGRTIGMGHIGLAAPMAMLPLFET
jgi:hypothetical protein